MRTTASGQSALLLLDVIDILSVRQIPYAVIGAFAASFYGMVRASLDADAVILVNTSRDIENLLSALRAAGLSADYRRGDVSDPVAAVLNVRDRFKNRVDLLSGIRGLTAVAFERLEHAKFMGSFVKIISREDFVAMKIFAGSPKDIQDVIGVLEVSGPKLNLKLLKKLTASYGADCAQKLRALLKDHSLDK